MATLQSNTFTVELNEGSENILRAARRLIFNSDFLKAAKICTGDIVILSNGGMSSTLAVRICEIPIHCICLGVIALNRYLIGQICSWRSVALA